MPIKPLPMPKLSELPNPAEDILGGLANPANLMKPSEESVAALYNPEPPKIKLSKQATEALSSAAREKRQLEAAIAQQQQQAQQAQLQALEAEAKASQDRQKAYFKAAEEQRKQVESEQGGVVGAARDGSFLLEGVANELIANEDWQGIASDVQRNDLMEQWLAERGEELRQAGVSEDVIANELDAGRKIISADTATYVNKMKSDNLDPLDLGTSVLKAVNALPSLASVLIGYEDGVRTTAEWNESLNETYSDTLLLDQANFNYLQSKDSESNPDARWWNKVGSTLKNAWDSGYTTGLVVDNLGYIPLSAIGGKVTIGGLGQLAKVARPSTAAVAASRAVPTTWAGRAAAKLINPQTIGTAITSGTLAASDAGTGAFEAVDSLDMSNEEDVNALRSNFIDSYSKGNWDALVDRHNGDLDSVKGELAISAGREAAGWGALVGAVSSGFDLDKAVIGMTTGGIAFQAGSRLKTIGINTVSETLEEAFTQVSQNLGATAYTGVDLSEGAAEAGVLGTIAGGITSAGVQGVGQLGQMRRGKTTPSFDPGQLTLEEYVSEGNLDLEKYRVAVGTQFGNIATDAYDVGMTADEARQLQQQTFDNVLDDPAKWASMTPEQQESFKDYLSLEWGINTNDYASHQATPAITAYNSGDLANVKNTGNEMLIGAFRVANGVEIDQVDPAARPTYEAVSEILERMSALPSDVNTHQREQQFRQVFREVVPKYNLTNIQKSGVANFMFNGADAGSRRLTDAEQARQNSINQAAEEIRQEGENGTREQEESVQVGRRAGQEDAGRQSAAGTASRRRGARNSGAQAEEVGESAQGDPGSSNTQSVGNDSTRQEVDASSRGDTTTQASRSPSRNPARTEQVQRAGGDQAATASPTVTGGTTPSQGVISPTVANGQPTGQINPGTTSPAESGGSSGATQTERSADGVSSETSQARQIALGEFNLQEILSGVTNARGEKSPSLNQLAPEDDTAARPTIRLTIDGESYEGRLFRYRENNKRYIAFVVDAKAYGLKDAGDNWVSFGSGVGTKRVNSINEQTDISIEVLDSPAQTQQESENAQAETIEDSPPPTEDGGENQGSEVRVGDVPQNDVQSGESSRTDGQRDESGTQETSREGRESRPLGGWNSLEEQGEGTQRVEDVITDEETLAIEDFLDENNEPDLTAAEFVEQVAVSRQINDTTSSDPLINLAEETAHIRRIINRIMKRLRNFLGMVSMAIAVGTGVNLTITTDVEAAVDLTPATGEVVMTSKAKASLDHILENNDNQGRPFVIADKKAGMLYLHTADGLMVNSTPALFGKDISDARAASRATGAGRYDLSYNTASELPTGYEGSIQEFDTAPDGSVFAIHRVLDMPGQDRPGRLASRTASDNRITYGCINVPKDFYNNHLDGELDAVLYVLPETDSWSGDLYGAGDGGRVIQDQVAGYDPATEVAPEFDNMNTDSVTVTADDINNSADYSSVTDAPAVAMQPAIIEGTTPTTQVAYTAPIVTNGATINTVYVDSEVSTPAEQRADSTFDTMPVTESVDGLNVAGIAINLAALLGGATYVSRRRKRKKLSSKKNARGTAVSDHNAEASKNKKANKLPHVNAGLESPAEATADIKAGNNSDWLEFIGETLAVNPQTGEKIETFTQSLSTFETAINEVLTDMSYTQAGSGVFNDRRAWRVNITDRNRSGVSAKFLNATSGSTPIFDNWLRENGAEAFGYEADSSVATKMLAQVSAKTNGAYGYIHKRYVRPLVTLVDRMAAEFKMPSAELEADIGNLATVTHILNEGASAFFAGKRKVIDELRINVDSIEAAMSGVPPQDPNYASLQEAKTKTEKEIKALEGELEAAEAAYEGTVEWDRETVKLPGGYTKAEAQKVVDTLRDKYKTRFGRVEDARVQVVRSIRGARQFATANGVYTNDNLRVFQELGFKDYVPLYSEDRDPRDIDESEYLSQSSRFDRLLESVPAAQARAMGLTKDLSRYHREGATSPADNAINNFKGMAVNLAKRTGQQGWINAVQQMYEGTLGQPISAAVITDEDTLNELNASSNSGAIPGLIRVRPGSESSLRSKDKIALGFNTPTPVLPIRAKGYNKHGELVDYNYYFVERAIANEIYTNTNVTVTLENRALRSVGTLTRMAAGMMTKFKPVWNVYNMARDIPERISIMLMRPVKDVNGNLVPKGKLLRAYAGHLARITASLEAQNEIYKYLVTGETTTELQRTLHEAAQEGAINLMTAQTERHSVTTNLSKSDIEKLVRAVSKSLGTTMNRTGVGQVANMANSAVDYYVQRLTEVPQVTVALAAYMSYADVNVNKQEAANRVRDQYDPLRTSGPWVDSAGQLYPFLRSTMSGHYNLYRSLSEYWNPGEWQWTATFLTAGVAGMVTVLGMAAGLLGDDEDGVPYISRLPIDTLVQGIPVPDGVGGVRIIPVGFGLPSVMWGVSANLYKFAEGEQDAGDMAASLAGIVINNSSPINVASGPALSDDIARGTILSVVPLIALPVVETAFGVRAYGGSKIYSRDTPRGERDSDQDSFTTPETYKKWAKALYATIGLDVRPETLRHWVENYSYGPLKAIPRSLIADKATKTLGYQTTKGEVAGPLITALGADTGWQPNALKAETYSWRLTGKVDELLIDAGVPRSHPAEDYKTYGIKKGEAGAAARLTMAKLRAMEADPLAITFVGNTLEYEAQKRKIQKDFRQAAMKYNRIREDGGEDIALRASVDRLGAELQELTETYVRENNNAYLNLL